MLKKLLMMVGATMMLHADYSYTFDADFLYWNAREDGLEYLAYSRGTINPGQSINLNLLETSSSWDPGVRLGFRAVDNCTGQVWALAWTHLNSKADSHVSTPTDEGSYYLIKRDTVIQFIPAFDIVDSFDADAHWKLDYDVLDVATSLPFDVCSGLTVNPFVGVRAAWINQKFDNNVTTLNFNVETNRFEKITNDFNGVGLRLGVGFTWDVCECFSLVATGSGSLLYGRFHVIDRVVTDSERLVGDYDFHRHRIRPNLEAYVGLSRNQPLFGCLGNIRIGYDFSYWFDQNQIPGQIQPDVTKSSDLAFQGLRVDFELDF